MGAAKPRDATSAAPVNNTARREKKLSIPACFYWEYGDRAISPNRQHSVTVFRSTWRDIHEGTKDGIPYSVPGIH
jgi:hypothetical protein